MRWKKLDKKSERGKQRTFCVIFAIKWSKKSKVKLIRKNSKLVKFSSKFHVIKLLWQLIFQSKDALHHQDVTEGILSSKNLS